LHWAFPLLTTHTFAFLIHPHDRLDWGAVEFLAEIDFIKTAFHMECFGNILLSPRRP
jgi:hypothetical protein